MHFLGSDPTLFTAAPPDSREVNYEETDRELARLSAIIKQSQASAVVAAAPSLRLDCVVAGQLELCRHPRKAWSTSASPSPPRPHHQADHQPAQPGSGQSLQEHDQSEHRHQLRHP